VEVLITLALVAGGYALANALHISGPLAIVVAGLLIGNHGRALAMSLVTREHLDTFWELVDEILNAVLFVLIGLEMVVLALTQKYLLAGIMAIPLVLLARFVSVGIPITLLRMRREFSPNVVKILTWGGLRGGISVALALSLPPGPHRELILVMTYMVVVFSILVQGLTIKKLAAAK
jgi:CPA1 family monovalent cation:H+ antiporter